MKKFFKLIFILIVLNYNKNVYAMEYGELEVKYEDNIYYTLTDNKGLNISGLFPFYTIKNSVVYCISPNENVNTRDYKGAEGFIYFPYNAGIYYEFDKIGQYGYEYPNHNTLKYRIATQVLIWETLGKKVEVWSNKNESVKLIDISKEKEEIKKLSNNHLKLPSFDNDTIITYVNEEVSIIDDNNVLNNYEIIDDGCNKIEKNNNQLNITTFKPGVSKIKLNTIKYDDEDSIIYVGNVINSKLLGKFRTNVTKTSSINIKTVGAKIKLVNIDEETNEEIKSKVKFKIKNLDTNSYICENNECVYETNEEGIFITNTYLAGNYQIERIDNIKGYLNKDNVIKVLIDENTDLDDDYIYEVKYENERLLSSVKIKVNGQKISFLNNSYIYEDSPLENAIYGLYANEDIYLVNKLIYKKDELIKELVTDKDGQSIVNKLELGKYYLKELKSSNDNIIDKKKHEFILEEQTKEFNFNNYLSKGILEINKDIDEFNLIEIYYNNNNENLLIYQEYQNNNIMINDLPLGKYYLKEKEQKIQFEINDNGKHIKLSIKNTKVFDIPNTYSNNINIYNFIVLLLLIVSLGIMKHEKYKKLYTVILIIISSSLLIINSIYKVYLNLENDYKIKKYIFNSNKINDLNNKKVEYIGVIQIPKINLEKVFYDINNVKNNIEENIQLIEGSDMPNVINGIMVIAAHSGNNSNAFFTNLNKLDIADKVYVYYDNSKYIYEIIDYYKSEKNGKLEIENKNDGILVLTTCDELDKTKQIVYISKKISVN